MQKRNIGDVQIFPIKWDPDELFLFQWYNACQIFLFCTLYVMQEVQQLVHFLFEIVPLFQRLAGWQQQGSATMFKIK